MDQANSGDPNAGPANLLTLATPIAKPLTLAKCVLGTELFKSTKDVVKHK